MKALVGWILALGLVVTPAMAKAGSAAGDDSPAAAAADKSADASTTASASASEAAPAASSPAPAAAAPAPQDDKPSPLYFSIGSAHFTPVGFMDLTNVFRTKATGNGIGSNFAGIPYNNSLPTAGLTEDRFSAQNSRVGMRVDSKVWGGDAVGYVEADFLGGTNSNINDTSNSNTLRMRLYFIDYRKDKWEILAGQDWSMLTSNRTGIGFMPADVFNTQDMDTNYQLGLVWERTPQFRFILHPTKTLAFGVSVENPQQYIGGATTFPANTATQVSLGQSFNNAGGISITNGLAVPNVAPDVIVKASYDPKFGMRSAHIEAAGLYRVFRINNFSGSTNFGNTTTSGAGVAVNSNWEIIKNFKLFENAFWSDGGGREIGNSSVPDFIIRPAPANAGVTSPGNLYGISPVHAGSGIVGFEYQTTPKLLLYGYFSGVYVDRNFSLTPAVCGTNNTTFTSPCGYGYPGSANSSNRVSHEGTIGWVQYFWRNANYGAVSMINQISYLDRYPWDPTATGTNRPKDAHDLTVYIDLRYTLP